MSAPLAEPDAEDPRYTYELPEELIARFPTPERDASRLMSVETDTGRIDDLGLFRRLPDHLRPGDLLVMNDTRVFRARVRGKRRTGGAVEAVLLSRNGPVVPALIRPLTKLKPGEEIMFGDVTAKLGKKLEGGPVELDFGERSISEFLELHGEVPIPPYFRRRPDAADAERYQTVYASHSDREGAVAAPTAGLHFTPALMDQVRKIGVEIVFLTLHVGYGTFAPVEPGQTRLHHESYEIPPQAAERILARRGRLIAVGTTVVRALEAWKASGQLQASTDIYIRPGHRFQAVDALITNFHLPQSSLLRLVHAFAGDVIFDAYRRAIKEGWRFFSYGDAMFIRSGQEL